MTAKVTFSGTIPVAQYANIQPSFDVEAESHEAAVELGLQRMRDIWNRTAERPLDINRGKPEVPQGQILQCRVSGAQVIFDPIAHTYHDLQGRRYTGGSTFASRYKKPFEGELIAGKMAAKNGVEAQQILDMWALNAEASSTFGTSVHAALQLYGEYLELSKRIKDGSDESALTSNPVLRPIVRAFFTPERQQETAYYEEFVCDPKSLACGLIDRLTVEPDGLFVEDFKSSASVEKPETILEPFKDVVPHTVLGAFWLQLSYYARILTAYGRNVKGLRVHHWVPDVGWETHEHPVVDLTPAFQS